MTTRYLVEVPTGCWIWTGSMDRRGYGKHNRGDLAHRVLYEQYVGPIPPGLELDHLCRVPHCVNPDHLEPVTTAENQRRRYALQTECHLGHSLVDEGNVRRNPADGRRICRACDVIRQRRAKACRLGSAV